MTAPYIELIPLRQLSLSESNVRKTPASPAADAELDASIEAHGVRQNLQVLLSGSASADDAYEVVAGGRRLRSLLRLATAGKIDRDTYPVPCLIMGEHEEVAEISLAENVIREDMHPVDQVTAFCELHAAGHTVEHIAARFGVAAVTVEKRLRLGSVHPDLLAAYREEKLNMDCLMAFTVSSDPKQQLKLWKAMKHSYHVSAWYIREQLTDSKMDGSSPIALYVGVEAYEEAGGKVTRDLFAQRDSKGIYIDDAALMRSLALKKLTKVAAAIKKEEGWLWADVILEYDHNVIGQYDRFHAPEPEATPEEAEKLEAIEEQMQAFPEEETDDDGGDGGDEWDKLEQQHREITEAIEQRTSFTREQKKASGVVLYLTGGGQIHYEGGLIRPEDASEAKTVEEGQVQHRRTASREKAAADPEKQKRKEAGMSQALADDLKTIRGSIVKATLAQQPEVAGDLLTFQLGRQFLGAVTTWDPKALDLSGNATSTHPPSRHNDDGFTADNFGEALFRQTGEQLQQAHKDWLPVEFGQESRPVLDCWRTFRALEQDRKDAVLAYCVAAMVQNQLSIESRRAVELEAAIEEIQPPLNHHKMSAATFWSRIPKTAILKTMAETGDQEWADGFKGYKKGELAECAEAVFRNPDGEPTLSERARDRLRRWTPPGFAPALVDAATE